MPIPRLFLLPVFSGAVALLGLVAGCASPPAAAPLDLPRQTVATQTALQPASAPVAPGGESARNVTPAGFADWVSDVRAQARGAGIGESALRDAFDDVRYLPRVIELDRAQPEFTRSVWDYLDAAVSPQRVALGEQKLAQVRTQADAAAARYGVPAATVVAIWGMESNYGGNYGNIPTIDALATLGFEGRRQAWARDQLMAALKIIDSGDIHHAQMIGSWAGAMGQTQFLPSSFLAYAVDADGDGRRDIWGSMADVLASTANYLARSGWQPGEAWGAEVQLPAGFDYARADRVVRQASAQWAAEGVRGMGGAALPELADASVLLPAGARGPAFLVGRNFRAILRYNSSDSYALGVSLLSQRLAGGPGVVAAWPREQQVLSRAQVLALQTRLNQLGFDSGSPDGMMGPSTRDGLRKYQRSLGLPADGYPTVELLERLSAS
ncbi:lytic murein transglycosylase [Variovorax ginsengisoli]|uniref:Lytic murein transglycosylase n=1 Tax=Variovorax ginsengisoli TaxID=363844 RepID=A0ABT9S3W2_9BURK|nr:lytic murein transglycosylase [Variovorax ginsengisoli]MDP9899034.1 lytic murein transglycosylase [Variovorax ginsengisoli]